MSPGVKCFQKHDSSSAGQRSWSFDLDDLYILVRFGLLSGHLLGKPVPSVDHMFSLYFDYLENMYYLFPVLVLGRD